MLTTKSSTTIQDFQTSSGWYCPGCKQYHGPHVDTCPNGQNVPKEPYQAPYPYVPQWPTPSPYSPTGTWGTRECPKCGLTISNIMMYVCSNLDCPTGLGGTAMLTEVKDGKSNI